MSSVKIIEYNGNIKYTGELESLIDSGYTFVSHTAVYDSTMDNYIHWYTLVRR